MANDFVHLHVHSEYSMLDGLGRIKELVKEAKRLGQPALALTDHGVMHGAIEFFRACKDYDIKPIVGVEAYQTVWGRPMGGRDGQLDRENYHLLLMAKNMTGYRNLLKIASHSQLNGYYYKPRVDHDFLANHAEGIICTTGCLGAEVPQLLMQGKEQEAYNRLGWYVDLFGKENFYIELQEHSIPELIPVNKSLVPWAEKFGIGLLATNDVHYVKETDADPHEMLLCVQTGESVKSTKRMRLSDQSYFLKSREQMEATFRPFIDLPASAYDNSLRIAEMVDIDLEDKSYHLPDMPIPEGFTYDTYLRHLTEEGLVRLYKERANNEEIQKRKEFELSVIKKMGFDIYFLIVADLCRFALSRNIWWNVRGSGAGSLVAYCTGITGIDPLKNNLIFERFLNPARVTMPDFDLDFPDDQREEMIRYTIEKYGKEKVAQIVTFGRMKARAAIKDVGRAQEIPLNQVNRISQLIPAIPGKPVLIKEVMTEGHEFYNPELVQLYKNEPWVTSLLDYSMQLEGVTRHSGIHAAAVIVADKELVNYAPLMRPSKGSVTETVAQFEFPILESIGLLKVDFLGLSTLSVMREAGRLIKERHGIEYTLHTIPFEGEVTAEAFKLLSSGEVSGVFQVESAGMRRVLTEMKPHLFEHIIATISLYRPGPLEYIPNYIRRLHGDEPIEYKHETLKSILEETYGIVIYQEQIIQILNKLAGYTAGEADLVRRAISKKKASDIEKHKKIFVDGCAKNNIPKDAAEAIYGDIEFFARYGFNKSHAADYAAITVQTAYLKAHYPIEYMAALLLIERDKTEKVVNFINECRRMGISVLPPDVNYSGLDFDIQTLPPDLEPARRDPMLAFKFPVPEGSAIRFGMAAVKMVGEGPVNVILEARREGGPFKSLEEFADRIDLRKVGKRPIECLIKVGAFDRFGKRSQLLAVIDQMVANSGSVHDARASGQLSMFDLIGGGAAASISTLKLPNIEEIKGREKLMWEKELLGVYAASHPMQSLGIDMSKIVTCYCNELSEEHNGKNVTLAGMITTVRTINTKKGDQMAFVQLEDRQGQCEVVVFPRTYLEVKDKLVPDTLVIMKGKAQTREGQTSLLVDSIQTYVDQAVAGGADPIQYQRPLLDVAAPTINGLAIQEAPAPYATSMPTFGMNDDDDFGATEEENPFHLDMPQWLPTDAPSLPAAPGNRTLPTALPVPAIVTAKADKSQKPTLPDSVAQAVDTATPTNETTKPPHEKPVATDPLTTEPLTTDPLPPTASPVEANKRISITSSLTGALNQTGNGHAQPGNGSVHHNGTNGTHDKGEDEKSKVVPVKPPAPQAVSEAADAKAVSVPSNTNRTKSAAPSDSQRDTTNGHRKGRHPDGGNQHPDERRLHITFRRSGNLDRDKYRLKEIYDHVRDPRGRDRFFIVLESNGQRCELAFPNDPCSINERLMSELTKHFRVDVVVEEEGKSGF